MNRWNFYKKNLNDLISKEKKLLVVSPNEYEIKIYIEQGYSNIVFGEFNEEQLKYLQNKYREIKNIKFAKVDLLKINFDDQTFDYAITQATLHHLNNPHQGLLELYRVSKFGTFIIEGNDNLILKLASKLSFSEEFEFSSVKDGKGGLMETGIANYVFRWTEREVTKSLNAYKPNIVHKIKFKYGLDIFNQALEKRKIIRILKYLLSTIVYFMFLINPKYGNLFLIYIDKANSNKRF